MKHPHYHVRGVEIFHHTLCGIYISPIGGQGMKIRPIYLESNLMCVISERKDKVCRSCRRELRKLIEYRKALRALDRLYDGD